MAAAGLNYWTRWQVFVCALIVVGPAVVAVVALARARRRRPAPEPLLRTAEGLWGPCWRRVRPGWLLAYRGLVFLGMASLLARMVALGGFGEFYYYTQWTFTLVIIYFAIATVISARGCWSDSKKYAAEIGEADGLLKSGIELNDPEGSTIRMNKDNNTTTSLPDDCEQERNETCVGFWGHAMLIVYQTCAGAVMLTDVVFWAVLVPFLKSNHFTVNLITSCMHSLNAVFLLIDTALNNLPLPGFGMTYFVLWSCIYVSFQWILHACGLSWWPYPFLELGTPWAVAWYICIALVHIPCYGFYWLVVRAKHKFLPRLFPNAYLESH